MPSLNSRLDKIEQQTLVGARRQAQVEDDAAEVAARIGRIAASFSESDATSGEAKQARWSPAQRVAWASRFAPHRVGPLLREYVG